MELVRFVNPKDQQLNTVKEKRAGWPRQVLRFVSAPLKLCRWSLIYFDPSLKDATILEWMSGILLLTIKSLLCILMIIFILIVFYIKVAFWLRDLPHPPPTLQLDDCTGIVPDVYWSQYYYGKHRQRHVDLHRMIYAKGLPEHLKGPLTEEINAYCRKYRKEERQYEKVVEDTRIEHDRKEEEAFELYMKMMYEREKALEKARIAKFGWVQPAPPSIPCCLLRYAGPLPYEVGIWTKLRYFAYQHGLVESF